MAMMDFDHTWVDRFVALQLKDLQGEELTPEERGFLTRIELAGHAFPEVLVEELLQSRLRALAPNAGIAYRIAAADVTAESALYHDVQQAMQHGKNFVFLKVGAASLPVIHIHAEENLAAPCYQEGFTFVVERKSDEQQIVGKYGGIFISLDDLKSMELSTDETTKTIRLYER